MNKKLLLALCTMLLLLSLSGCGGIQNVLKSGDSELMYTTALKHYQKEKWTKASTLLEAVEPVYVGSPREDSIAFFNARCKFKGRDYETAATLLDEFRRKFGRSVFIEEAEGMYALCFYQMAPGPSRDQTMTGRAIIAISEFLSHYPRSERAETFRQINSELNERLNDKAYLNAYTYYKIGRYKSAIFALKNALKQYPESKHREQIMYLIVSSAHKLAQNSIAAKQADRYLSMLDSYYSFVAEYPNSDYIRELERMATEAKNYLDSNNKDNR